MSSTTPPPTAPAAPITVPTSPTDKETRPLPAAPQPSSPPPPPPATETEYQKGRERFHNKQSSEYFDPCQEAAARSLRCLTRNQGDKDLCSDYFQAYRDCKKRWTEERKAEKRKLTAW